VADALFYLLALGAIVFGVGVVTARMPLFSVLSLLGVFVCLAVVYLLAGFQFLAVTQVLVYAGAIMVLFLFVIMLLNLGDPSQAAQAPLVAKGRIALAGTVAGALALVGVLAPGFGEPVAPDAATLEHGVDRLVPLAEVLFTRYLLPFEASSLLLLATMIAVIALAKRQRAGTWNAVERAGWPWQRRQAG